MFINKNINIQLTAIITIVCLVIIVLYYIYTGIEKDNVKKIKKGSINCDTNGCPEKNEQNAIYSIHESYKVKRDKNDALIKSSDSVFFKKSSNKGPKNIFIIRHGEKKDTDPSLDCNGILRSTYIPDLIEELNNKGYGINAIITMTSYVSMHVQQTITLTSWLLDIPMFIYGEQNDQKITIENVFKNPYFTGKNVLICWEHTCIQEMVQQIINIGPMVKGLTNYRFVNPDGNSGLPNWGHNNYQSVLHFDDELNFEAFTESFTTCYSEDNDQLVYGVNQKCKKVPNYTIQ